MVGGVILRVHGAGRPGHVRVAVRVAVTVPVGVAVLGVRGRVQQRLAREHQLEGQRHDGSRGSESESCAQARHGGREVIPWFRGLSNDGLACRADATLQPVT